MKSLVLLYTIMQNKQSMSVVRKMVSIDRCDADYLKDNAISLSQFVRINVRKLKETGSTLKEEPASNLVRSTNDYK